MWQTILTQLGIFGISVTALGWLAQRIFLHWLDKNVARFKIELQGSYDKELERLRSDLRLKSIEHEIRFRSIYERQAEAFEHTYARLQALYAVASSYVADLEWSDALSKEQKFQEAAEKCKEFRSYFYPRRILFPKDTGDRVNKLGDAIVGAINMYTRGLQKEKAGRSPQPGKPDPIEDAIKKMDEEIPALLMLLERDFQQLLGIISPGDGNRDRQEDKKQKEGTESNHAQSVPG